MAANRKNHDESVSLYMQQHVASRMESVYAAFAEPVDVHRVLDHHAAEYTRKYGPDNEFVKARDAFAALAEASARLDNMLAHPEGGTSGADVEAFRAALVRCGVTQP